jgi:signal transduction histidine kinase
MLRRLKNLLYLNRLQRKVVLLVVVIILVPMVVTGLVSSAWITARMDASTEHWIREAAQVNRDWLNTLNNNARLFADLFEHQVGPEPRIVAGQSPIPTQLEPLARELGINLVQVFDPQGRPIYSSPGVSLDSSWQPGQDKAVLKVTQGDKNLLAAVTILRFPKQAERHYRLVFGTLFDKQLLARLGRISGLKTRLFYPRDGDFAKAFSEESRPLKLRLPPQAFAQLQQQQDYYSVKAENGKYRGLYTPITDSTGQVEAVLFNGLAHQGAEDVLSDHTSLTLTIILFGSLLAIAVGLVLSHMVVRPVTYLHEAVMKIAAQDFRTNLPMNWHDEIGDLTRAFNSMVAKLRASRDEQRREFQRDKIASLGELSLAMAHELRNPIGVINTASKLLDKDPPPEKRRELQRMIHEGCQRMDQFLKDFQQLARHRQPQFTQIDPATPLEKALQVMLAGKDELTFERHFNHGNSCILADAELLQQAWVNLVRNAIEAMDGQGHFTVGSEIEGNEIVVYLQDSGPGIPVELMTRLFEPFYTTKNEGTGLGLTLANTLVTASGASLELVPDVESGARFAMRFNMLEESECNAQS